MTTKTKNRIAAFALWTAAALVVGPVIATVTAATLYFVNKSQP